jgi:hypothetical protein
VPGEALFHRRSGALQRAVHRRDADVEEPGGLGSGPAEDVPRDQDNSLARRQELDRGDERELDRLLRDDRLIRAVLVRGDPLEQLVRVGLEPVDLGELPLNVLRRRQARRKVSCTTSSDSSNDPSIR